MPFSYGGGIKNLNDIENCLNLGCDKISLNSSLRKNKNFLKEAVNEFGSQAITVSVDYIVENSKAFLYDHVSSKKLDFNLIDFIKSVYDLNCGEILLSSVNSDGYLNGYDFFVLNQIRSEIDCPIILSGGCGKPSDMLNAFENDADACGAGSIFYYTKYGYQDIKKFLKEKQIKIR
jgi:cyclase